MKTIASLALVAHTILVAAQEHAVDPRAFGFGGRGGYGGGPFGDGGSGCAVSLGSPLHCIDLLECDGQLT